MSYSQEDAPALYGVLQARDNETGGDSAMGNINSPYLSGDSAYIIVASAMVLVMPAGLGFLYSGLARRKSALSMVAACMGSFIIITAQWYIWGYSLAFSSSGTSGFIGDLQRVALTGILDGSPAGTPLVSELLFSFYQMQFCATTAAIVAGAVAERGRLGPFLVFIACWSSIVYCPIAYWAWNVNGWAFKYSVMDYAGGGPVEICSGMSALAYSWILGRRQQKLLISFRPHNVSMIVLGTVLLWYGWLGFNGGSAFGANLRAVMACWNSNLTAMFAAAAWVALDYRLAKKYSVVGFCSGAISGLVAATPASGFITPWGSVILGLVTGVVCNYATKVKYWLKIDDSFDVFSEHGIAGMLGLLANALFGADWVISLDGVNQLNGGWLNQNWAQLYIQIAYIVAATAYSFVVSAILAYLINLIPGLKLRASEEAELLGMDDSELGEFSYDYVEVRRDYLAGYPAGTDGEIAPSDRHGIPAHAEMLSGKGVDGSDGSGHEEATVITGSGEKKTVKLPATGDRHGIAAEKAMHPDLHHEDDEKVH